MWIQTDKDNLVSLFNTEYMDEPVEFSENGTANVSEDVAEQLIDNYDSITPTEDN